MRLVDWHWFKIKTNFRKKDTEPPIENKKAKSWTAKASACGQKSLLIPTQNVQCVSSD